MTISSARENRIVLESGKEKAVVSRNAFGENDKQWLLTANEKINDTASDSTIDIKSEPEGKQNGTAPLQNNIESNTKIQNNEETLITNTPANGDVSVGTEANVPQGENE